MKTLCQHFFPRLSVVAVLMFSWLVATNHCAIGLMKPAAQGEAEHAHCHGGKPDSGKDAPADGPKECCKSIHGAPAPATVEAKFDATKFQVQLSAIVGEFAAEDLLRTTCIPFDHGPPRAISFAESVLQRSLFGNAPPSLV